MLGARISTHSFDHGTQSADRPGGQARGFGRVRCCVGWEILGVAGCEVRQVRAAERRLRQDVRRYVFPGEVGQSVELSPDIQRQDTHDLELPGVRGARRQPASRFE
jgi:hypothetical protein